MPSFNSLHTAYIFLTLLLCVPLERIHLLEHFRTSIKYSAINRLSSCLGDSNWYSILHSNILPKIQKECHCYKGLALPMLGTSFTHHISSSDYFYSLWEITSFELFHSQDYPAHFLFDLAHSIISLFNKGLQ